MHHLRLGRFIAFLTALMTLSFVGRYIAEHATTLGFTWRWIALPIVLAIISLFGLLVLLWRRSSSRQAPLVWFYWIIFANITMLATTLMQSLSSTAPAAAFWQGLLPMTWLPLPVLMLFFAVSYLRDEVMPFGYAATAVIFWALGLLLFIAGVTPLIEHHLPVHARLEYWGYQSETGPLSGVAYSWVIVLCIISISLLYKAWRSAPQGLRRQQLKIFFAGFVQYVAMGIIFDMVLYIPFPDLTPPMGFLYATVFVFIIGYGILKYGLFQINPVALSSTILNNLSEAVIGLNPQYGVEFANAGYQRLFGRDPERIRGQPLSALMPAPAFAVVRAQIEAGKEYFEIEDINLSHADGPAVPVSLTVSAVHSEQGKVAGYVAVATTIAELKQKSRELEREKASVERKVVQRTRQLHDEQARLRASIEAMNQGFALVDAKGRLILQNRAWQKMLGLAKPAATLAEADVKFTNYSLAQQCDQTTTESRPVETDNVSHGSHIWRIYTAPVHTLNDERIQVIGTIVIIEDFTEAKVLERSRDEFFSIASHELRTPLTAIRGNAAMALEQYGEVLKQPELHEMLSDIRESGERLISIVNDFLDVSRLEQGKMVFDVQPIQLEPVLERVVYEMKAVLREKHLHLTLKHLTLDELPMVLGDANRIKQVVYNLVGNAAIYTTKGGITISAHVDDRSVTIDVTDTGRGISIEDQKYLFHKFQQASGSLLTRDTTRGTGLGLYISKLMLERMGGSVQLSWSEPGKGSTFSFTLPRAGNDPSEIVA